MHRKLLGILIAGGLVLGAGSARAAPLSFTGTLSVTLWWFAGTAAPGAGIGVVNGSAGGGHLTSLALAGGSFGPVTTSLPVTSSATVQSARFTGIGNLTGSFTGISGGPPGGGPMGVTGLAKICFIFDITCTYVSVAIPLTPTTGGVGFGRGGTQVISGAIDYTFQHAPWTVGQPVVTSHSPGSTLHTPALPGGFVHGPASLTSSTAQPSGVMQLVTVTKAFTSLTGAFPEMPVIGVLTLHFVPEPGTLLLLGAGVGGLAALGRRRGSRVRRGGES